jgi:threonine/homoserine efflux transporter RhtA
VINAIATARKSTHIIVAGLATIGLWMLSPQGQEIIGAIVHAYPRVAGLVTILSLIAASYRKS